MMNLLAVLATLNLLCFPIIFVIAIRRRKHFWLLLPPTAIHLAWITVGPEYLTYRFGGGFGPGTLSTLFMSIFLLLSSITFVIGGIIVARAFWKEPNRNRWYIAYILGSIFLCIFMGLPMGIANEKQEECDQLNRQEAERIATALNSYQSEQGHYPKDLRVLVPAYLPTLPTPHCFANYDEVRVSRGFGESSTMSAGPPGFVLCDRVVAIPVITYGWLQMYDLETGEWSTRSFLDIPSCYDKSLGR